MKCETCGSLLNSVKLWSTKEIKGLDSETNPNEQSMYWINKDDFEKTIKYYEKLLNKVK